MLAKDDTATHHDAVMGARAPGFWRRWRRMVWTSWHDLGAAAQGRVRLHTLVLIRWAAVVGQLFTVLLVHYSLGFELPLVPLVAAIGLSAAINLALGLSFKATTRLSERGAAVLLGYDIAQLCFLLALTGGLQNPFALLLLVPVTLAATTLGLRPTLLLCCLAITGATLLAFPQTPLPWHDGGLVLPGLYVFGLWAALVLGTTLTAACAWRIAEEARRMSDALAATQMALAREQQLSALGGLAAAAAHELGSPLATIQVTAKELARALPPASALAEDAQELLEQAARCREILAAFSHDRSIDDHEPFTRAPVSSLLESIALEYRRPEVEVRIRVEGQEPEPSLTLTPDVRHALANLIDNAIQFARSRVDIAVRPRRTTLELVIEDDGPGFAPDVLEWLGEPYLSTRREDGGLGLGVFIATTLLARTGATATFDNGRRGARVVLVWPRPALEPASPTEEAHDGRQGREPAAAGNL
jgi:two-component system, sensor histidine kinase RegB